MKWISLCTPRGIVLIMYVKNITLSKYTVKAHLSTILQNLCLALSHTTVMSIITVNNFLHYCIEIKEHEKTKESTNENTMVEKFFKS